MPADSRPESATHPGAKTTRTAQGSALEVSAPAGQERVSLQQYARLVRDNANFRRLWLAQMVSEIGDWFYTVTIYNLLLQFTGRAETVGLALVLQVLPQTVAGPAAGVINDRLRRKHVMITADLLRAGIVLAMLMAFSPSSVWLVYPLLLAETVAAAFFEPARSSVIPNITGREQVIVANTLSSITWSFNLAIGATLGGLVAVLFGRGTVFVLNALSFVVSALLIRRMRFEEPHAEGRPPLQVRELVNFSPIAEGVRYVRGNARLATTLFAKCGLGLMIGATWVIYTIMGERLFPVRPMQLGAERAAMLGMSLLIGARGLGALVGPLAAANWAGQHDSRLRAGILLGFLAGATGVLLISAAPNIWFACACVVLAHCGGSVVWVFSTTLLQLHTSDRYRGRVFSADLGLCMLAISVTAWLASVAADAQIPVRWLAAATAIAMFATAGAWAWAQGMWRMSRAAE